MRLIIALSACFAVVSAIPPSVHNPAHANIDVSAHVRASSGLFGTPEPSPRLVIYVQTFKTPDGKPLSLLPLLDNETKVTHVILASVHLHEKPGEIRLNDDPFDAIAWSETWKEVKILQDHGVKVMALLGGAAGGTYKHLNGTEKEFYSYYHPLLELFKKHNLDGIDIDVEEDVNVSVPLRLLNAFHRDMGPSFILTMAPLASALSDKSGQNLSGFSYFELDSLATVPGSDKKLISWFNVMFYGRFPRGPPVFRSVLEAGWDPERVVMGVLDCAEDGQPNGFVHIETLQNTITDLIAEFPRFGGVAGWEYHDAGLSDRDDMQPWEWVKEVGKALFGDLPKMVASRVSTEL